VKINSVLSGVGNRKFLVVGDLMVDHFLRGCRSAETNSFGYAGHQTVGEDLYEATDEIVQAGGAARVATNLAALGANVVCLGVVGQDERGRWIEQWLKDHGVRTNIVSVSGRPTSMKLRVQRRDQSPETVMQRIDLETTADIPSEAVDALLVAFRAEIVDATAVVFEDLEKGVLTPDLVLRAAQEANCRDIPLLVDPKHDWAKYRGIDIAAILPNRKEFLRGGLKRAAPEWSEKWSATSPDVSDEDVSQALEEWRAIAGWVITGRETPMITCERHATPTWVADVFDLPVLWTNVDPERRVGCGSAFTAGFAMAYGIVRSIKDAATFAAVVGGIQAGLDLSEFVSPSHVSNPGTLPRPTNHREVKAGRHAKALGFLESSGAKRVVHEVLPGVVGDELGRLADAIDRLISFLDSPRGRHGLLAFGASGSGKSTIVQELLRHRNVAFAPINAPAVVKAGALEKVFSEFLQSKNSIAFLDEFLKCEVSLRSLTGPLRQGDLWLDNQKVALDDKKLLAVGSIQESCEEIDPDVNRRFELQEIPSPVEAQEIIDVFAYSLLVKLCVYQADVSKALLFAVVLKAIDTPNANRSQFAEWASHVAGEGGCPVASQRWIDAGFEARYLEQGRQEFGENVIFVSRDERTACKA
jgi:rfaE bifunctional protein kinase chain/domain